MLGLDDDLIDGLDDISADDLSAMPPEASPAMAQILELLEQVEDPNDLYHLKLIVEGRLPAIDLDTLDLEAELATQLRDARALMAATLHNKYIPANQKAQTVTTVTRALDAIATAQVKVYNAERVKVMEQALMTVLREHPDAGQLVDDFEATYERMLRSKK